MLETLQSLLDTFPEAVIQVRGGSVESVNAMARHYLPDLEVGTPLPGYLVLPRSAPSGAGAFSLGTESYTFSCTNSGAEQMILLRPAPQTALTERQFSGVLRQLRQLLGDFLSELGPLTGEEGGSLPRSDLSKSFHRIFRLLGNLEYMQESSGPEGIPFRPDVIDLDGLCRHMVADAYPLLVQAGIKLEYESVCSGLLIPGDPQLLQRMLLALISNSARASGEGTILLSLRSQSGRALLSLSDSGPLPSPRQLAALFQQGTEQELPLPGQGAGLGLSIARHIVSLHRGALLVEWGQSSPEILISLPTGPLEPRTQVRSPLPPQRDAGLDPVLVELSDVLPASAFDLEGLD